MAEVAITWLGHAGFRIDGGGKRIYVDAWTDCPTFPESERPIERIDILAFTHGHDDHTGSAVELAQAHSPTVVAQNELAAWLQSKGVENLVAFNKGGTVDVDGVRLTMTHAVHSSSTEDGTYAGEAAGLVLEVDGKRIYHAGDTAVFGDMQLIGRLHEPDIAILPIGDHFTMGPQEAALALELLGVRRCIPCHYGTFPLLTGTPEECAKLVRGCELVVLEPGGRTEV